ncbi:hypothetical protein ACFUTV_25355 [Streptomyces sp. NPDC057298]|uniref:hypothetical protein n=1 Tax=Streptomyces sp. NPDC057298 TaxID=3346091 RepID=UPI003642BA58
MWEQDGTPALRRRPAAGRPPKLETTQAAEVRQALEQGAQAHGFEADLWTLERVGAVVERVSGRASKKGAVNKRAWIVFFDKSGVSLLPQVRRTYAPRGRTPTLRHRLYWNRASMAEHETDPAASEDAFACVDREAGPDGGGLPGAARRARAART